MIFNFCEKCGSVLTGTMKDESRLTCSNCLEWKSTANASYEKQEMLNKMGNNPDVKAYTSEFDRIQNMKKLFSQINKAGE